LLVVSNPTMISFRINVTAKINISVYNSNINSCKIFCTFFGFKAMPSLFFYARNYVTINTKSIWRLNKVRIVLIIFYVKNI